MINSSELKIQLFEFLVNKNPYECLSLLEYQKSLANNKLEDPNRSSYDEKNCYNVLDVVNDTNLWLILNYYLGTDSD